MVPSLPKEWSSDRRPFPEDWNSIKKEVYNRDNYICQNCGVKVESKIKTRLHVYHVVPTSRGGKFHPDNLSTVCDSCYNLINNHNISAKNELPYNWDAIRKEIYQRDNYSCKNCGVGGGPNGDIELHVHHIIPKSKHGTHQRGNLTTLCFACHSKVHDRDLSPPESPIMYDESEEAMIYEKQTDEISPSQQTTRSEKPKLDSNENHRNENERVQKTDSATSFKNKAVSFIRRFVGFLSIIVGTIGILIILAQFVGFGVSIMLIILFILFAAKMYN